jgi:hypothetical protein
LPFSADEWLRSIHSRAHGSGGDSAEPNRLVYCLFATAPPAALWRQPQAGDTDLGRVIALRDFEREEVFHVIDGLASWLLEKSPPAVSAELSIMKAVLREILDRVFYWTNGHPYLTQKLACAATHPLSHGVSADSVMHSQRNVDSLCECLFVSERARAEDCHLLWMREKLLTCGLELSRVAELLGRLRQGADPGAASCTDSEKLINSGVVHLRGGWVTWRNRIYERVFDNLWLSQPLRGLRLSPAFSRGTIPASETTEPPVNRLVNLLHFAPC